MDEFPIIQYTDDKTGKQYPLYIDKTQADILVKAADAAGLEGELRKSFFITPFVESGLLVNKTINGKKQQVFNPRINRTSTSGAKGAFQFMPNTIKHLGIKDPLDFNEAAFASAKYMSDLHKMAVERGEKDPVLATSVYYNAGPNAGTVNTGKDTDKPLKDETKQYVQRKRLNKEAVTEFVSTVVGLDYTPAEDDSKSKTKEQTKQKEPVVVERANDKIPSPHQGRLSKYKNTWTNPTSMAIKDRELMGENLYEDGGNLKDAGMSLLQSGAGIVNNVQTLRDGNKSNNAGAIGGLIGTAVDVGAMAFGVPTMGLGNKVGTAVGNKFANKSMQNLNQFYKQPNQFQNGGQMNETKFNDLKSWYNNLTEEKKQRLWSMDDSSESYNSEEYKRFNEYKNKILVNSNDKNSPKAQYLNRKLLNLQNGGNLDKKAEIEGDEYIFNSKGLNQSSIKMTNNTAIDTVSDVGFLVKGDSHKNGGIDVLEGDAYIASKYLGVNGKKASKKNDSVAKTMLKEGGGVLAEYNDADKFSVSHKYTPNSYKYLVKNMQDVADKAEYNKQIEESIKQIDSDMKNYKMGGYTSNNIIPKSLQDAYKYRQSGGKLNTSPLSMTYNDDLLQYMQDGGQMGMQDPMMAQSMEQQGVPPEMAQGQAQQDPSQQGSILDQIPPEQQEQVMQMAQAAMQGDQQAMQQLTQMLGEEGVQMLMQELQAQGGAQGQPQPNPSNDAAQQAMGQVPPMMMRGGNLSQRYNRY